MRRTTMPDGCGRRSAGALNPAGRQCPDVPGKRRNGWWRRTNGRRPGRRWRSRHDADDASRPASTGNAATAGHARGDATSAAAGRSTAEQPTDRAEPNDSFRSKLLRSSAEPFSPGPNCGSAADDVRFENAVEFPGRPGSGLVGNQLVGQSAATVWAARHIHATSCEHFPHRTNIAGIRDSACEITFSTRVAPWTDEKRPRRLGPARPVLRGVWSTT